MDIFLEYCVLYEKKNGIPQIRIFPRSSPNKIKVILETEEPCCIEPAINSNFNCNTFKFRLNNPLIKQKVYEYNFEQGNSMYFIFL